MIFKKHMLLLILSLPFGLLLSNLTETSFIKLIRSINISLRKKGKIYSYNENGIPVVDYQYFGKIYVGKQINPIRVSTTAVKYYKYIKSGNESYKDAFLSCCNWLSENTVRHGDSLLLEYNFPYPKYNMVSPWRSGMAQAHAIRALIRAHKLTKKPDYLEIATGLLNAFFIEVSNGGVTYKSDDNGWWYEEYADDNGKKSMVLNGMMDAVVGIYEFYEYTGSNKAKYLFDQGVKSLKFNLQCFDNNGYSDYDILGKPAGKYHKKHVRRLYFFYQVTKDPKFLRYYHRWKSYKKPILLFRFFKYPTLAVFLILLIHILFVFLFLELICFSYIKLFYRKRNLA